MQHTIIILRTGIRSEGRDMEFLLWKRFSKPLKIPSSTWILNHRMLIRIGWPLR
ncbi:putative glycerophosphodiester phosphodiesterase [Burkholderia pseudomallei MSHR4303]|nr:putative glycerophosphodiester phosphodiesterase [Burkholderia pseudomallei MSHR4303]